MRTFAIWSALRVAVRVTSLAGYLALGTFLTSQSICPDGMDCEDATNASILFFAIAAFGAAALALTWRLLSPRSRQDKLR